MNRNLLILVICAVLLGAGLHASAATRVFLLAGQSNMVGVGEASDLKAPYDKPPANVKIWGGKGWKELGPGVSNKPNRFGPEIAFGHAMSKAYPDDEIYLIKYAAGGTALYNDWSPKEGGPQYKQFMSTAQAALKNLDEAGVKYSIDGMLWMQGESDAYEGQGAAYEENLTAFIKHMREAFKAKDLPFILGRILTHYDRPKGNNAQVRAAQLKVSEEMDRVAWFDTDDFDRFNAGHYSSQGLIDLGKGFAETFLEMVKDQSGGKQPDR